MFTGKRKKTTDCEGTNKDSKMVDGWRNKFLKRLNLQLAHLGVCRVSLVMYQICKIVEDENSRLRDYCVRKSEVAI
jgi:hypothetical protein